MPRLRRAPSPDPDERQAALPLAKAPARRAPPTPEEVAKIVTDKRPSPVGQPTKVEISLRLVLPRAVLERLSARAIREGRNVEGLIQEIIEGG
jgi:hypothetical protein